MFRPLLIHPPHNGLVVSVHDVSPLTRSATERILEELNALGVECCSLLVIPDHHRQGHYLDDPDFCQWLRCRVAKGDEVVIHGYCHRRDRRAEESFKEKITTRIYTAGEGEFFDIAGADALRIVSEARQEFRKIGIIPHGFIAPAWLLSEGGEQALRALGISYTTRLSGIYDFEHARIYTSQSLVWSVRSAWRRLASRCWNAHLFRKLQKSPLMRIGIHPPDIEHPAIWQQITALTRQALAERRPVTYEGYLRGAKERFPAPI
ncbi:MAG: polysaccharide deacetylase family protein [Verrucomicrobiota bacterium]